MIAEPYICITGARAGEIRWFGAVDSRYLDSAGEYHCEGVRWRVYADFEREKLREIFGGGVSLDIDPLGFHIACLRSKPHYDSAVLTGYTAGDYQRDSESSRVLKRAEFLKAVCEKEGVEWLPKPVEPWKPSAAQEKLRRSDNERVEEMLRYHRDNCTDPNCSCHLISLNSKNATKSQDSKPEEQECGLCNDGKDLPQGLKCRRCKRVCIYKSDDCKVEFYTKAEEKEFRRELLDFLQANMSTIIGFDDLSAKYL